MADQSVDACGRAIAALVVLHGLSPKEVGDLRVRDYGRRKRVLRVARRSLVLDLDPVTAEAIDAYVRARPVSALNSFLFVSHRTRLGDEPVSNGFVRARLRPLGIDSRATRQRLMRMLAVDDGTVIAARYFRTDARVVDSHNTHQVALFRKSSRAVTESVQAAL
jgi:integrase